MGYGSQVPSSVHSDLNFVFSFDEIMILFKPDGGSKRTGKLTESSRKIKGTVPRNSRTNPSHLFLDTRLVLDTSGHVSPRAVLLTLGHVVAPTVAHDGTRVTDIRLGTVAREAGTRDQLLATS